MQAVHEAFRLGINFFDTSPFYGSTRSEQASRGAARRSEPCVAPPQTGCRARAAPAQLRAQLLPLQPAP